MKFKPWQSVQARFAAVMVLVTSCVLGGFTYFNYQSSKSERLGEVNFQIEQIANRLPKSLANSIWELNKAATVQIVDGEISESFLEGITVVANGELIYGVNSRREAISDLTKVPTSVTKRVLDVVYGQTNMKIATVTLYLNFDQVNQRLQRDLWVAVLQFVALSLTTVLAILGAMRRVVIRPIRELSAALAHAAGGDADLSLRLPEAESFEFAEVTHNFNYFVEKLHVVMGGSIDGVQAAIAKVARGELDADAMPTSLSDRSVMGRLVVMRNNLRALQAAESSNQEALQDANRTLEKALDLARAATWSRDMVHTPTRIDFSPRAMLLLGFLPRADNQVDVAEIEARLRTVPGDALNEQAQQAIRDVIDGVADTYEIKYALERESDGSVMWVHDIGSMKRGAQQDAITMHGVLRDITAERAAEDALRSAMRDAEAASVAKGEFLANMSHEIRTPMNAIIGLSGLALRQEMPPRIHDYLSKIRQSGEHLLGIINDILDFSKIESGKMDIEAVPFVLDSVIDTVVNLLSEKVEDKGLELLCRVGADVPKDLVGDPLRIGQILINLANNAVKFTAAGEVRLSIAVQQALDDQVTLLFQVSDTGIGLSPEQIGKLFKSFAQADASTTRKFGGTGLGLAISKSLAEAMGGGVGVDSELGQGSTFWFTARLGLGASSPQLKPPAAELRGSSVLVVDDNQASALLLSDMLGELGFAVAAVNSGQAALDTLLLAKRSDKPFQCVLMDWQMPCMDGLQTVAAIQAQQLQTAPIVLMVTAHRRQELLRSAQSLGIEYVLSKPVSGSLLVNTMMQMAGYARAESTAASTAWGHSPKEMRLEALAGARVLLVEDNEINQQVACELLQGVGLVVDVADNGQIAVDRVQASADAGLPYDLVLMDMQMPVMDGVTASVLIRKTFAAEQLPIVAMTANAMAADRERCLNAGMNGFVTKPIDPEELWKALLQQVKVRAGMGPQAAPTVAQPAAGRDDVPDLMPDLMPALLSIQELDVNLGLARTTNNPAFYASMLRKFVAAQEGATARVQQALDGGDVATAERIAHTLKGLAGNLGASGLQDSAALLEAAVRTGAPLPDLTGALDHTAAALQRLMTQLKAAPGLVPQPGSVQAELSDGEREGALLVIEQIRQLLQDDDAAALELWERHAAVLRTLYPQAAQIEAAIAGFAFEEALQLLV